MENKEEWGATYEVELSDELLSYVRSVDDVTLADYMNAYMWLNVGLPNGRKGVILF